jgi:EmrB/QacA subfamily drug resistance transporter
MAATAGSRPPTMALVAFGLSIVAVANDFTALNVTIPTIERSFDASLSTTQWVLNAYTLVFAMLIVPGGRLCDLYGAERCFLAGAAIFLGFSVVSALAPSVEVLIGARALMGVGGALIWPACLSMTFAAFGPDGAGKAGAFVVGVAGLANALGPIDGGLLTDVGSWRWVFVLNVPIAVFAMLVVARRVPAEGPSREAAGLDGAGIALLALGLLAFLLALDQAPLWGWVDVRTLGLLAAALLAGAAFVLVQRRKGSSALVPADVIRDRDFAGACAAIGLMGISFGSVLLFLPQIVQKVLDRNALESGLAMLPLLLTYAAMSFAAPRLADRWGAKAVLGGGALAMTAGVALLALAPQAVAFTDLIPGMVVFGAGLGLFYSTITTAGVVALSAARQGLAGGVLYMCNLVGLSVGVGLTTTVATGVTDARLQDAVPGLGAATAEDRLVLHGLLAGTESAAAATAQLGAGAAERLEQALRDAFMSGVTAGFVVDAVLAGLGALFAIAFVGSRLRRRRGAAQPDPGTLS